MLWNVTTIPAMQYNGSDRTAVSGNVDYVSVILYSIICLCGLTGNVIAMLVVIIYPSLRTASNILIFNLALSDFIFLLSQPFYVAFIVLRKWIFGEALCRLHYGCFGVTLFTGVYTLVLMSFDRYVAVCKNRWHGYRTVKCSIVSSAAVWIVSGFLLSPLLIYSTHNNEDLTCTLELPQNGSDDGPVGSAYTIYMMVLGFALPLTVISAFYGLILIRLHQHSPPTRSTCIQNRKRTRRVTVLVLGVILAYMICWLPYWLMQLYFLSLGPNAKIGPVVFRAYHVATILYHANSMLNPILYGFLSATFRKGVFSLLQCRRNLITGSETMASNASMLVNRSLRPETVDHRALLASNISSQQLTTDRCRDVGSSRSSLNTCTAGNGRLLNPTAEDTMKQTTKIWVRAPYRNILYIPIACGLWLLGSRVK